MKYNISTPQTLYNDLKEWVRTIQLDLETFIEGYHYM